MKSTQQFVAFLGLLIFISVFASCKKDNDDATDNNNNTGSPTDTTGTNNPTPADSTERLFTATIDGTAFATDTTTIAYQYDQALGLHIFSGEDGQGHIITIMLSSLEIGSYPVDFDHAIVLYQSGTTVYNGGFNPQGNIVITHNQNNEISGTFEASLFDFNTAQDVNVTNGHFIRLGYN